MNRILFFIILLITTYTYGQSFEGQITYKVIIKVNSESSFGISEKKMIEHLKNSGEYFDTLVINIKNGNYEKLINKKKPIRSVYKSGINKIYTFQTGSELVFIKDAKKYSPENLPIGKPKIIHNDSTVSIMGKECKSITLDNGMYGKETYFYNDSILKIDSELFKDHNTGYLNEILTLTKSYPIQITNLSVNSFEVKMILVDYSEKEISDSAFEIPKLKPAKNENSEMKMYGDEVMQIENER